MKPPSKKLIIAFIAVVLIFVVLAIALPEDKTDASEANLILISDTDQPIGSIGVSYARYDGSVTTGACTNADGSMILRGDSVWFEVNWPVTVTVYADLQGGEKLLSFVLEGPSEVGAVCEVTLYDGLDGLTHAEKILPKEET